MGSSLIFLGLSVLIFIVTFAILYNIVPTILGAVFTEFGKIVDSGAVNNEWAATYDEIDEVARWLVPLMMTLGLTIMVIKVLMAAAARGND